MAIHGDYIYVTGALWSGPTDAAFGAERKFDISYTAVPDHKAGECPAILRGEQRPEKCTIFGTVCTPDTPVGASMVSSEGACAAQ